jgi:pimeloyl-ACP methyl ester carboxylesterase
MLGWIVSGIGLPIVAVIAFLVVRIATYTDRGHAEVAEAGYVLKTAQVNGVTFSYAEGPDNGPPLVLLHAQLLDWFSYARVLPALSKHFHVFDVDYPGHGATRAPADYPMTADRIGADLADLISQKIGEPVFITGNSSGGLLSVWLAANRPALIRAAMLEDPPLFSAEYPRIKQTVAYRAFRTSDSATRDHPKDFLRYWIDGNAGFFTRNVGPGTPALLRASLSIFRWTHPENQPAELGILPNETVRMLIRGLDLYDPRFGAAFYDGSWNTGFDHAAALRRILCPTLLLQANTAYLPDGALNGAMSREEGDRAAALLRNGRFVHVGAGHVINIERPALFVSLAERFFLRATMPSISLSRKCERPPVSLNVAMARRSRSASPDVKPAPSTATRIACSWNTGTPSVFSSTRRSSGVG